MRRQINNKKGFSLVEIIVSILILALLSLGIMSGIGFSQKMTKGNIERDAKMALVQEVVDDVATLINNDPDEIFEMLGLPVDEMNLPIETEHNGIVISIDQQTYEDKVNGYYEIELWEIEATLEYETSNGLESVSLTRLALPRAKN